MDKIEEFVKKWYLTESGCKCDECLKEDDEEKTDMTKDLQSLVNSAIADLQEDLPENMKTFLDFIPPEYHKDFEIVISMYGKSKIEEQKETIRKKNVTIKNLKKKVKRLKWELSNAYPLKDSDFGRQF